jgi:uncharacterized Tic20 family protein
MITIILILAYCLVGLIFTHGITKEYRQDTSNEIKDFSPAFVKVCIFAVSVWWPVLLAVAAYKTYKGKSK